jgi:hypothetical protein
MINRRRVIRLAAWGLPATLLRSHSALAQQAYQRFVPFLVDLDGWQGKKAEGVALDMAGNRMITATREYQRAPARLHAQVLSGTAAQAAVAGMQALNIETADGHMNTSTIDGVRVTKTYNNKDKSGAIMVALAPDAMLTVTYNGLAEDEAFAVARKFNWKAIQAALPGK